jgi:5-oxoprolinase (ATP-hydrolysing)
MSSSKWQFWIDRGGTFTDIVARRPDGRLLTHKLLSENPRQYADAALAGVRQLLGLAVDAPVPAAEVEVLKMGTTLGTNALLERKGARVALVITAGLGDAIRIGYQHRPDIFALHIQRPPMLYERVIEARERVQADGMVRVALDAEPLRADLSAAHAAGIEAVAIVFMHGYRYPAHERQAAQIAREIGFRHVAVSHEVSPLIKLVARGDTTLVDAYLTPLLADYVVGIRSGVRDARVLFMQSNGGLVDAAHFRGRDCLLSGPAGGIAGAVKTSAAAGLDKIITFDMGGTSTDVAHYDGEYERSFETEVAGCRMRVPMLHIHTVAAGGGSVLHFDGRRFAVGPDSAGAYPGPASYRNGGPLAVTDCNLLLGRIQAAHFPSVFGPQGDLPLATDAVQGGFAELAVRVRGQLGGARGPEDIAEGFLAVAVENMAEAIKKITLARGFDTSEYTLCCFGGAGGQVVCRVADALGIGRVFVHPLAGVLSAYGMGLADQRAIFEESVDLSLEEAAMHELGRRMDALAARGAAALREQGVDAGRIETARVAQLKYAGTDTALPVPWGSRAEMRAAFETAYERLYGFAEPALPVRVEVLVAEAVGRAPDAGAVFAAAEATGQPCEQSRLFVDGAWHTALLYRRADLRPGLRVAGPALVAEPTSTLVIDPGWQAEVAAQGELLLTRRVPLPRREAIGTQVDPVMLEIFNKRFMAVAEEMGIVLQHTAHSVNIKERLDFSCAIFDGEAELIANAPHIPVHLGSMGDSVRAIRARFAQDMRPGDVFLLNSPYHGGTHLPDITVVTPVWDESGRAILFYTASRGHHADVGGITPGSMPPDSTRIEEEGAWSEGLRIVSANRFLEADVRAWLGGGPHPARNPSQNIADLKAQVAANAKGAQELRKLVARFSLATVTAYMRHALDHGEAAVRDALDRLQDGAFVLPMDSGAQIAVRISIDRQARRACIDFDGTSAQQPDNFNAPASICKAAVLYVFRTLVRQDIPLNAGCLRPLEIRIPEGSMLNPSYPAAVVAGNVETSQAIVDAVYGALGVLAASQGTMNNFTFGDGAHQYYETICGGAGAGAGFDGADAVQTHMTNSRLTDPEVLEQRFPVLVEAFSIRAGSGGVGIHRGGDGTLRRIRFLQPMQAAILSGRRRIVPFGLAGGLAGAPGSNSVVHADGRTEPLPACAQITVAPGDAIAIATTGGGGYGAPKTHAG